MVILAKTRGVYKAFFTQRKNLFKGNPRRRHFSPGPHAGRVKGCGAKKIMARGESKKRGTWARKKLAEVHGNRTHLPPYSEGTPDLKSGGPTSEPGTSNENLAQAPALVNRGSPGARGGDRPAPAVLAPKSRLSGGRTRNLRAPHHRHLPAPGPWQAEPPGFLDGGVNRRPLQPQLALGEPRRGFRLPGHAAENHVWPGPPDRGLPHHPLRAHLGPGG